MFSEIVEVSSVVGLCDLPALLAHLEGVHPRC